MSKKCQNEINKQATSDSDKKDVKNLKLHENALLDNVVGSSNVKRWNALKVAFSCKSNENFATKLLDIAQEFLNGNSTSLKEYAPANKRGGHRQIPKRIRKKNTQTKKIKKQDTKHNEVFCEDNKNKIVQITTIEPQPIEDKTLVKKCITNNNIVTPNVSVKPPKETLVPTYSILKESLSKNDATPTNTEEKVKKKKSGSPQEKPSKKDKVELKKKLDYDVRKAPELEIQNDVKLEPKCNELEKQDSIVPPKTKLCPNCNTCHLENECPLHLPHYLINDTYNHSDWCEKYKSLYKNQSDTDVKGEETEEDAESCSYSKLSIPSVLYLEETSTSHGLGVYSKIEIQPFTQFGPLVGKTVKEVDIPEDFSMRDLWEIVCENGNVYVNTEDLEVTNWIRFLRPAPTREEKNLSVICRGNKLYFVSVRAIEKGEELLFWQDSTVATSKKKLEKTSCGGCNMVFNHPIYYRTHCAVFHDVRYSLTIRKYHCKICGAAVLGKENIMKHAAELHNGQGAYQCQFCKKFFLRLNYLEMHRTYGCSANPHRSRPLCDFCGRKFCQPQKLKVHIKRMHSDFSEVLKEFQCKSCLKILGSRAALQRHLKEVHQKQLDGACSCSRCGKHFQNKSNLKIHMLTHSGIKPFKCTASSCNAAFTTKQCLQFHYKKVHNYTEDSMPKIERSIDYTFQAYSGFEDELEKNHELSNSPNKRTSSNSLEDDMSDIDDVDDVSLDSKSMDDPPALQSPLLLTDEQSPQRMDSPIPLEPTYVSQPMKILSKGSKKWIGDQPLQLLKPTELYQMDHRLNKEELSNITLQVQESEMYERGKLSGLNEFTRQDASNASLLVEAALDSVCSEPNIDIDVSSTPNCDESLVNNLYTLAQPDNLTDVTYSDNVCMSEQRDINLISPSVNDHISVTDELTDELRHSHSISMDYSNFHQEDFSPENSPGMHNRSNFVRNYINNLSPHNHGYNQKDMQSPVPSPPRYDFGHAVNNEHLSSDDSNGMAAQNLSLNNSKNDEIQLDLSIYKSPYKLDNYQRKDFTSRLKFDGELDRKISVLGVDNLTKNYDNNNLDQDQVYNMQQHELSNNNMQGVEVDDKEMEENHERVKYPDDLSTDIRNKFELDLDLRLKNYEIDSETLRQRSSYETPTGDLDFRSKNYDLIDSIDSRTKSYENLDADFRSDRNFEPLVLNSSEIQGLDMSARSFHNYPNINRYHHLYPEVDRVDLRLNYSPPPPTYTHADILRVVSLDLTPPGRHSVDLSLRGHPLHQIANTRLLSEHAIHQTRLLGSDLGSSRHLTGESRLLTEATGRILSDHTTNRILGNDHLLGSENRLLSDESRILAEQPRLLEQSRLIGDARILPPATPNGSVSPVPTFSGYGVSQSPYHPTPLAPRPHVSSPTATPYHHYSSYY